METKVHVIISTWKKTESLESHSYETMQMEREKTVGPLCLPPSKMPDVTPSRMLENAHLQKKIHIFSSFILVLRRKN